MTSALTAKTRTSKRASASKMSLWNKHIARHTDEEPGLLPTLGLLCFRDLG